MTAWGLVKEMSCGAEYGDFKVVNESHFGFSQKFMHKIEWGEVLQWGRNQSPDFHFSGHFHCKFYNRCCKAQCSSVNLQFIHAEQS